MTTSIDQVVEKLKKLPEITVFCSKNGDFFRITVKNYKSIISRGGWGIFNYLRCNITSDELDVINPLSFRNCICIWKSIYLTHSAKVRQRPY